MRKFHTILGPIFISFAANAYAQKIASVACYSGGDHPVQSYNGTLGDAEIVDLPHGGFNVKGRQIDIRKLNVPSMASICRNWYLGASQSSTGGYNYYNRDRSWNVFKVATSASLQRMTCASGSIVAEFDSTDAYKAEILRVNVDPMPPSPGKRNSLDGYFSGILTVSSSDCVLFDF